VVTHEEDEVVDLDGRHRVQSLMTRTAVYVHGNDTLRDAAQTLVEESVGAALVRGPHGLIGLVSERDLVRAVADGASAARTPVSDVMSVDLVTAAPNDELLDVVRRMFDAEIRHIPVMEDGTPVGMISMRDALQSFARSL
jgi:CBS domain-containing protein